MPLNGSLKTRELKLQGSANAPDYKMKVEDDELHIKRGNMSLMTISPDEEGVLSGDVSSGSDKITISAPVTFTSDVTIEGKLIHECKDEEGCCLHEHEHNHGNVLLPEGGTEINWARKSLLNALTGIEQVPSQSASSLDNSESFYFNKKSVSTVDADGNRTLKYDAHEVWGLKAEFHQTPDVGAPKERFLYSRWDPVAKETFKHLTIDNQPDPKFTTETVSQIIADTNKIMNATAPGLKYMPDERSKKHADAAAREGLSYFTEMNKRSKVGDMQLEFTTSSYSRTLPIDPTDCWRGYTTLVKEVDPDAEVAFQNGSQTINVVNGISSYYPKLQYRGGNEQAVVELEVSNGEVVSAQLTNPGVGYNKAPTEVKIVGGYNDARIAIDMSNSYELSSAIPVTIMDGGGGYIANSDGTLPLYFEDSFANAYAYLAEGHAVIVDGKVSEVVITKSGDGYYANVTSWGGPLQYSDSPYPDSGLFVSVVGGRDFPTLSFVKDSESTGLSEVNIVSKGSGMTSAPSVQLSGAQDWLWGDATATVVDGVIQDITLTETGGYMTDDVVVKISGSGSGASATVSRNSDGTLSSVTITNGGSGYDDETKVLVTGGRPWINENRILENATSKLTFGPFFHFFANSDESYVVWAANDLVSSDPETGAPDFSYGGFSYVPRLVQYLAYKPEKTVTDFITNFYNDETTVQNADAIDPYMPMIGTMRPELVLIPDNGAVVNSSRMPHQPTIDTLVESYFNAVDSSGNNLVEKYLENCPAEGHFLYVCNEIKKANNGNLDKVKEFNLTYASAGLLAHEWGHAHGLSHTGENAATYGNNVRREMDDDTFMSSLAGSHDSDICCIPQSSKYGQMRNSTTRFDGTVIVPPGQNIMSYGDSASSSFNKEQRAITRAFISQLKPKSVQYVRPEAPHVGFISDFDGAGIEAETVQTGLAKFTRIESDAHHARYAEVMSAHVCGQLYAEMISSRDVKINNLETMGKVVLTSSGGKKYTLSVNDDGSIATELTDTIAHGSHSHSAHMNR
jgi:hypothetical protein